MPNLSGGGYGLMYRMSILSKTSHKSYHKHCLTNNGEIPKRAGWWLVRCGDQERPIYKLYERIDGKIHCHARGDADTISATIDRLLTYYGVDPNWDHMERHQKHMDEISNLTMKNGRPHPISVPHSYDAMLRNVRRAIQCQGRSTNR